MYNTLSPADRITRAPATAGALLPETGASKNCPPFSMIAYTFRFQPCLQFIRRYFESCSRGNPEIEEKRIQESDEIIRRANLTNFC